MCFNIVDLNYFPSNYICKGLVCFYISINRYDFVIFYFISFFFFSSFFFINIILLLLILFLYSFSVQALTLFPRCFFVIFRSFFWFSLFSWCTEVVQLCEWTYYSVKSNIQAAKAWSHGLFKCKLIGHEENTVSHVEEENYIIIMTLDDLLIILTIKLTVLSFPLFSDPCLVQTWFISKKEFYGFVTIFLVIFSGTKFSHLTS